MQEIPGSLGEPFTLLPPLPSELKLNTRPHEQQQRLEEEGDVFAAAAEEVWAEQGVPHSASTPLIHQHSQTELSPQQGGNGTFAAAPRLGREGSKRSHRREETRQTHPHTHSRSMTFGDTGWREPGRRRLDAYEGLPLDLQMELQKVKDLGTFKRQQWERSLTGRFWRLSSGSLRHALSVVSSLSDNLWLLGGGDRPLLLQQQRQFQHMRSSASAAGAASLVQSRAAGQGGSHLDEQQLEQASSPTHHSAPSLLMQQRSSSGEPALDRQQQGACFESTQCDGEGALSPSAWEERGQSSGFGGIHRQPVPGGCDLFPSSVSDLCDGSVNISGPSSQTDCLLTLLHTDPCFMCACAML